MKECILIITYFMSANFANAQNDTDFWLEEERLNQQFLQKHQEIQIMKHQMDSLNGAYVNSLIQILKSDFPLKESIEGHRKFLALLFENESDSTLYEIINNIDLYCEYLTKMPNGNFINNYYRDQRLGFNTIGYPIFNKIYDSNICLQNKIIFYFVNKFPLEEIKGDLKMKMWLKIFERNKAYFNECCNNYFTHSSDRAKFKKISEIRKIVNGE